MPPRSEEAQMEEQMGAWPRRLLHVPSMQSRAWLPGNRYGDAVAPQYNAISYTWGRFELQQDSDPSVSGLEVRGVDWNIPRTDPSHFTKEQFHRVVQAATHVSPRYYEDTKVREDVEFVWLDVACIDQP